MVGRRQKLNHRSTNWVIRRLIRQNRYRIIARYCKLSRQEQAKQHELQRRIQELEVGIGNRHEEEEVRHQFGNRARLRQSLMKWNEFEEDFEEFDEATEADQEARIKRLEEVLQQQANDLEDMEKENLDSRVVLMAEYKEQLKMVDFFKERIGTQIGKGELEQLRLQSKWSDRDVEFKVPLFYAKNGRVVPMKLPKHELAMKLAELHEGRTLRLKTDHMVERVSMSINLDEEEPKHGDDALSRNQQLDVSDYKSRVQIDEQPRVNRAANPMIKPRVFAKPKQTRLPPM